MPELTRLASVMAAPDSAATDNAVTEEQLGDQMLDLVGRLVANGSNPEAVLERAYRRRMAEASPN